MTSNIPIYCIIYYKRNFRRSFSFSLIPTYSVYITLRRRQWWLTVRVSTGGKWGKRIQTLTNTIHSIFLLGQEIDDLVSLRGWRVERLFRDRRTVWRTVGVSEGVLTGTDSVVNLRGGKTETWWKWGWLCDVPILSPRIVPRIVNRRFFSPASDPCRTEGKEKTDDGNIHLTAHMKVHILIRWRTLHQNQNSIKRWIPVATFKIKCLY